MRRQCSVPRADMSSPSRPQERAAFVWDYGIGRPHQKHSSPYTLNQDHKNFRIVRSGTMTTMRKIVGPPLSVRLLVETSKVNQCEQQQQNRRPVASQNRYELQRCADDKNEHRYCQRFLHRQRAGTGDQKLRRKQWPKEGDDGPRIDQPGKADRNGNRFPQSSLTPAPRRTSTASAGSTHVQMSTPDAVARA